jgi:hypothetical protein
MMDLRVELGEAGPGESRMTSSVASSMRRDTSCGWRVYGIIRHDNGGRRSRPLPVCRCPCLQLGSSGHLTGRVRVKSSARAGRAGAWRGFTPLAARRSGPCGLRAELDGGGLPVTPAGLPDVAIVSVASAVGASEAAATRYPLPPRNDTLAGISRPHGRGRPAGVAQLGRASAL